MNKLNEQVSRMRVMMGLNESVQLADKVYFNSGKLEPRVKEAIIGLTNGNNFTKLVTDFYYQMNRFESDQSKYTERNMDIVEDFYNLVRAYDKQLFPVPGNLTDYKYETQDNRFHVMSLYEMLRERSHLVKSWVKLSDIIKRNMMRPIKEYIYDIDTADSHYQLLISYNFKKVYEELKVINKILQALPEKKHDEMLPKLFRSGRSFKDIVAGFEHLSKAMSYIGDGAETGRKHVLDLLPYLDADLVYDKNDVLVIKVNDYEAMQQLGCYSNWCFAQVGSENYWDDYAGLGYVYVIMDFNMDIDDARFLMTYLPESDSLYLSNNTEWYEVYDVDFNKYLNTLGISSDMLDEGLNRIKKVMGLNEVNEPLKITPEYLKKRVPFLKSFNDYSSANWVQMQKIVYNGDVTWVMGDTPYKMKQLNTVSEFSHTVDRMDSERYRVTFSLRNEIVIMPEEGEMNNLLVRTLLYVIRAQSEMLSYKYDEVQKTPDIPEDLLNKIINEINGAFFRFEDYVTNHLQADLKNPLDEESSYDREKVAAGVIPYSKSTKTFLVGMRSGGVDNPHTWAGFGGGVDGGEDVEEAVMRELEEEIGFYGSMRLIKGYVYEEPMFEYHNFIGVVSDEFEPHLNWETDDYQWVTYDELLQLPHKHKGLVKFMNQSKDLFERLA